MDTFSAFVRALAAGRSWELVGDGDRVRAWLDEVYSERCHAARHHRERYQLRVNLQRKDDVASYAGWITADNPPSGPYQGTCFVWFPGETGSVVALGIGTDGFGADAHILGRPGHARRLRALARLHSGKLWVKPDLLDIQSDVPKPVSDQWPAIDAALNAYSKVLYAAVAVRSDADARAVADLMDLFFVEHGTPLTGKAKARWDERQVEMMGEVFPRLDEEQALAVVRERRFVVLEGPPGTGKTRLANRLADRIGSATRIQFHPARTYEDFVVGLYPQPAANGLAFHVRAGDLLVANRAAREREHMLLIDELNRADLSRVLGEAVSLFEVGEAQRSVKLPHVPAGFDAELRLDPKLCVLATRNLADRSIARIDIAIRRRFAFLAVWPDLAPVEAEGVDFAVRAFADTIGTFTEFADDEVLRLVPGHAYFLDPRPDLDQRERGGRVGRRMRHELVPLLRDYLDERLCGGASVAISGLADRIEWALLELA